jgi:pseudouridine-5'-phosphate glycosidase
MHGIDRRIKPMLTPANVHLSGEVEEAIATREPVVALESSIITHGLPHPANAETALRIERVVRDSGAIPATIALIEGKLRAGLSQDEIGKLAASRTALKASTRDLASLMVAGMTAGTTVAATMFIAAKANIKLFATGGIGGVHRDAEKTFDISADLAELARTPVAVVSAGAKSILDIGRTIELLETLGVPVIGYRTREFPAFFSRKSGRGIDHSFESIDEVAQVICQHWAIGSGGGLLIANPVPEMHALDGEAIEAAIEQALKDGTQDGISQKDVTPYLLARIVEITGGKSVRTNIELISHNAQVAAHIAVAYEKLMRSKR